MSAQKFVIGAALVALAAPLAAYGGWSTSSGPSLQKTADLYAIEKIEKIWHRSTSKKNLNLMMSLWAPGAVMTNGGKTYTGKKAIRSRAGQVRAVSGCEPLGLGHSGVQDARHRHRQQGDDLLRVPLHRRRHVARWRRLSARTSRCGRSPASG